MRQSYAASRQLIPASMDPLFQNALGIAEHPHFNNAMVVLILINTLLLSMEYDGMDAKYANVLQIGNLICTVAFTVELAVKMMAYEWSKLFKDKFTIIDALVVLLSWVEMSLSGSGSATALRAFRILRVLKFIKSWKSLQAFLATLARTCMELGNFLFIMFLVLFVYTLLGMQLFGGKFTAANGWEEKPRHNFDTFLHSFLTVFQVLTLEDWNMVMYDCVQATSEVSILYFVTFIIFGNFMVANLFIAIMLTNMVQQQQAEATLRKSLTHKNLLHILSVRCGDSLNSVAHAARSASLRRARSLARSSSIATLTRSMSVAAPARPSRRRRRASNLEPVEEEAEGGSEQEQQQSPRGRRASAPCTLPDTMEDEQDEGLQTGRQPDDEQGSVRTRVARLSIGSMDEGGYGNAPDPAMAAMASELVHEREEELDAEARASDALQTRTTHRRLSSPGTEARSAGSRAPLEDSSGDPDPPASDGELDALEEALSETQTARSSPPGGGEGTDAGRAVKAPSRGRKKLQPDWTGASGIKYDALQDHSFWCVPPSNSFRKWAFNIVDDKRVEALVLVLIVASSFLLAYESPDVEDNAHQSAALDTVDVVFTVIFAVEMLLKMVAFGLFLGPHSYFRDMWNCMDCFVVLVCIMSPLVKDVDIAWLRSLRTLRVIRPLRAIHHIPELKVAVNALFRSLPGLWNMLVVSGVFWVIFSILGMQLFMGKFRFCAAEREYADEKLYGVGRDECVDACINGPDVADPMECTGEDTEGNELVWERRVWTNEDQTFDNLMQAMSTLFTMATTEGWAGVMYSGMDSTGYTSGFAVDHAMQRSVFFVCFLIMGNFFVMNLFIGIIMDNFHKQHNEEHGQGSFLDDLMTKEQRAWVATTSQAIDTRLKYMPQKPESPNKRFIFQIVQSPQCEYFILACIVLNALVMACEHYGQSPEFEAGMENINLVFFLVFLGEAVAKIYSWSFQSYLKNNWNKFDFLVVASTFVGWFLDINASVLRIMRITRLFRIMQSMHGVRVLVETLWRSLPSLINIAGLMFLLFFVYAVLGMKLFGRVMFGENLTRHANFTNFWSSMLLLLRVATGEAWNAVMVDCMVQPPQCSKSAGNCGDEVVAPLFFFSFVMIGSLIMLNLVVAVVLENFSMSTVSVSEDKDALTAGKVDQFQNVWRRFDPECTNLVPLEHFTTLLRCLGPPLGLHKDCGYAAMTRFQYAIDLNVILQRPSNPVIEYHSTLQALVEHACRDVLSDMHEDVRKRIRQRADERKNQKLRRAAEQNQKTPKPAKAKLQPPREVPLKEIVAMGVIRRACRRWVQRKKLMQLAKDCKQLNEKVKADRIVSYFSQLIHATTPGVPPAHVTPAAYPTSRKSRRPRGSGRRHKAGERLKGTPAEGDSVVVEDHNPSASRNLASALFAGSPRRLAVPSDDQLEHPPPRAQPLDPIEPTQTLSSNPTDPDGVDGAAREETGRTPRAKARPPAAPPMYSADAGFDPASAKRLQEGLGLQETLKPHLQGERATSSERTAADWPRAVQGRRAIEQDQIPSSSTAKSNHKTASRSKGMKVADSATATSSRHETQCSSYTPLPFSHPSRCLKPDKAATRGVSLHTVPNHHPQPSSNSGIKTHDNAKHTNSHRTPTPPPQEDPRYLHVSTRWHDTEARPEMPLNESVPATRPDLIGEGSQPINYHQSMQHPTWRTPPWVHPWANLSSQQMPYNMSLRAIHSRELSPQPPDAARFESHTTVPASIGHPHPGTAMFPAAWSPAMSPFTPPMPYHSGFQGYDVPYAPWPHGFHQHAMPPSPFAYTANPLHQGFELSGNGLPLEGSAQSYRNPSSRPYYHTKETVGSRGKHRDRSRSADRERNRHRKSKQLIEDEELRRRRQRDIEQANSGRLYSDYANSLRHERVLDERRWEPDARDSSSRRRENREAGHRYNRESTREYRG